MFVKESKLDGVVGKMHNGGQCNSHVDGEKQGEDRHQQGAQSKSGEKRESGSNQGDDGDQQVIHDVFFYFSNNEVLAIVRL